MFKFKPADDRHEFKPLLVEIEERPLNPLGRAVFWIVIGAIFFTCLWMFFGEVDIVVSARGKVIPAGEVKTLQPLNAGVVRSILIQPGDYVTKGQILMEIDPSDVDPELASMQADLKQAQLEIVRINALLENRAFAIDDTQYDAEVLRVQQQLYLAEQARLRKQIQVKREGLVQLDERLAAEGKKAEQTGYLFDRSSEKLERLRQVKNIISRDEFERSEAEMTQYQSDLKAASYRVAELEALKMQTHQEIAAIEAEDRHRLLTDLAEKKQRYLYLHSRIEKALFVSTRQQLSAPVDGYVSQLLFHTIGGVVAPGEKLAYIVPSHSPLLIKALLPNQDAGFVAENMLASIKVDTFSFQKYGIIEGKVIQVSKDSLEDQRLGLVYELYIAPDKNTLMIDGVETPITVGMSVTSEVKVGKRRIIEFFLYPLIKYLDEGVSLI
ncbi:HlyD family type I secretion periplasmic adaptor subunit [Geopsychrobacter electrodiphilus]|uniref:HlyD family type I secretion periplasmic adaptor subunit n=1 Tax=Geopsychrobacter electrodiphilus TaxID=225196 RepID=UPI0003748CE4|nr:HlyD family type I secretion periplasmic adaptor subunit [Geopsychrobacter electrodiphilus]